jgi:hypothetical protein
MPTSLSQCKSKKNRGSKGFLGQFLTFVPLSLFLTIAKFMSTQTTTHKLPSFLAPLAKRIGEANTRLLGVHLLVIAALALLSLVYNYPLLEGKVMLQSDVVQATGAAQELKTYREATGKIALWTNGMFSGMPAYQIMMDYPKSLTIKVGRFLSYLLPEPANVVFVYLLGFYLMGAILGYRWWVALLGAFAFAFSTYNIISIEAGHISKALAIGFAPPMIGAIILAYRKNALVGAALAALFASIELYTNHIQITYYAVLAVGLYVLFELAWALMDEQRGQRLQQFAKASALLLLAGGLAIGSQASRLWGAYEYTAQTIRGKTELTPLNANSGESANGLSKEYAFQWSHGVAETLTFIVPNFYGGASGGNLSTKSNMYKTLTSRGVPEGAAADFVERLPLYWGDMPFTSGPAYMGAGLMFLFVLGFLISKDRLRWWVLSVVLLYTLIALGKNFAAFNYLLFDYLPLFNKFRAVTMILSLLPIFLAWMMMLGIEQVILIAQPATTEPTNKATKVRVSPAKPALTPRQLAVAQQVVIVGAVFGGFLLLVAFVAKGMLSYIGPGDERFLASLTQSAGPEFAQELMRALRSDRADLMSSDALRSLIFVLAAAGVCWLWLRQQLNYTWSAVLLLAIVLIDLWGIDRRYLNADSFRTRSEVRQVLERKTPADEQIQQDKDLHYRVLNLTTDPFQDATTSLNHRSVGGYHGAKLRRYQDLIERHLQNELRTAFTLLQTRGTLQTQAQDSLQLRVLNMLNTKYLLVGAQSGQTTAVKNPMALGNAWFVEKYNIARNPDEEIALLYQLDTRREAVVDERFKTLLPAELKSDAQARIDLKSYQPDELVYETQAASPQLAVFSEIYYEPGWQAYLNDKPVPHLRTNYVLRALPVPAGKHKVSFRFEPKSYYIGSQIDLVCSILLFLGLGLVTWVQLRKETDE